MQQEHHLGIIPPQYTGKEIKAESTKIFEHESVVARRFEVARKKLLDVNNWNRVAGVITAQFQVVDRDGREVIREVRKNDYLKINIPGPGNKEGDGYDWVQVEELKEISEGAFRSIGFRVRPTANPFSQKNETAHFYSDDATSSFIISCANNKITSLIVDRNLRPNTESDSLVDKVRDVIIGVSAIGGFSKIQWQGLANGLLAEQ